MKRENLHLTDPPVHGYIQDFESNTRTFLYDKKISDTVSAFVLKYVLDYNYMFKSVGGYSTTPIDQQVALSLLRRDFPIETQIENYFLFELPGIIAILGEGHVHVQYIVSPQLLPASLKEFSKSKISGGGEQFVP